MAFFRKIMVAVAMMVCSALMMISGISLQVHAATTDTVVKPEEALGGDEISPLGKTVWRYKIENGNLYKRLMDCNTGQWLGEWILVGPA